MGKCILPKPFTSVHLSLEITMQTNRAVFLVLILFAATAFAGPAGTIEKVIGTADVYHAGGKRWEPVHSGFKIFAKDFCRTGAASSLEIRWANGGILRLGEKS